MLTLRELVHKNFASNNQTILNELVKYGFLTENEISEIIQHDSFNKFFKRKKPSSERDGTIIHHKCLARIWTNGECRNVQCSFEKHNSSDFCKKHGNKAQQFGSWYLGKITEKCPDTPIHPGNGRDPSDPKYIPPHETKWLCDENGVKAITKQITEVSSEKKEKKELSNGAKKKRGRPPGSKNKKKKKEMKQTVDQDKIIIQGKPYTIIDGEIWDTENTGKHIGTLQQGQIIYNKN